MQLTAISRSRCGKSYLPTTSCVPSNVNYRPASRSLRPGPSPRSTSAAARRRCSARRGSRGFLMSCEAVFTIAPDAEVTLEANPGRRHARGREELARGRGEPPLHRRAEFRCQGTGVDAPHPHARPNGPRGGPRARRRHHRPLARSHLRAAVARCAATGSATCHTRSRCRRIISRSTGSPWSPAPPLGRWQARGDVTEAPEEKYEREFLAAHDRLAAAGFEHYEVSNYARPGARARHNGSYWRRVPYLGLGPSAHSFDGERRWWNIAPYAEWSRAALGGGEVIEDSEMLVRRERGRRARVPRTPHRGWSRDHAVAPRNGRAMDRCRLGDRVRRPSAPHRHGLAASRYARDSLDRHRESFLACTSCRRSHLPIASAGCSRRSSRATWRRPSPRARAPSRGASASASRRRRSATR